MRGYPKYVATKQDFINLLADSDMKARALTDLQAIRDMDDATATRVVSIADDGTEEIETIPNPMPSWKVKGFESREELDELIASYQ